MHLIASLIKRLYKYDYTISRSLLSFVKHEKRGKMSEPSKPDQIDRLWDYRLHQENIYFNLLNFFLVFESILLAAVGILYSRTNSTSLGLRAIALLGFCLTITWAYTQYWQAHTIARLKTYLRETVPEYKLIQDLRSKRVHPVRTLHLLTYLIPILVALIWLAFLDFF